MKAVFALFLLFSLLQLAAHAQSDRLTMLQEQRESAMERAIAPINAKYVQELEKLLKILTASGELKEALIVKEEIAKYKSEGLLTDGKPELSLKFLNGTLWKNIEGSGTGVWKFSNSAFELYKVDDKDQLEPSENGERKYRIADTEKRTIEITWTGGKATHTFNESFTTLEGDGKVFRRLDESELKKR